MTPRLLSREQAAAYVGLSANQFDEEVRAGRFPTPVDLFVTRRRLWDRCAIDAALDAEITSILDGPNGFETRKARWQQRHQDRQKDPV
jgi:predicted DNA-binding transcriptional regulator AlpA